MAGINVQHINPFLVASSQILNQVCGFNTKVGKPYIRKTQFTQDTVVILIGVTGEMRGQVLLSFKNAIACEIASKMMMMPIEKMDEISMSAVCELGNMILGNAATIFSTNGINIDITPPTICQGNVSFSNHTTNFCVPVIYEEDKSMEVNISVQ